MYTSIERPLHQNKEGYQKGGGETRAGGVRAFPLACTRCLKGTRRDAFEGKKKGNRGVGKKVRIVIEGGGERKWTLRDLLRTRTRADGLMEKKTIKR